MSAHLFYNLWHIFCNYNLSITDISGSLKVINTKVCYTRSVLYKHRIIQNRAIRYLSPWKLTFHILNCEALKSSISQSNHIYICYFTSKIKTAFVYSAIYLLNSRTLARDLHTTKQITNNCLLNFQQVFLELISYKIFTINGIGRYLFSSKKWWARI